MNSGLPSEEIKARLDVIDVISGYVKLTKAGVNYRAVCPFHSENTPSFFVSPQKQIWNCFGCGEGGDIFRFVMKMEGVEFVDALRILAKKSGVELKAENPELKTERAVLQEICAQASRYFQNNLSSENGKNAYDYLKSRGLSDETISEFKIGYAIPSWDGLYNFLSLKGFEKDKIEKAGLALASLKSGTKRYFDRFRDRIMFPISDANGYIVGFTGRYLAPKENEGKYVNTPQTLLYDKSNILYGLDKNKMEIRKKNEALLVEGQMDLISAWQDGVKNVVATSGTALTQGQLKLLKRYTNNIKISFDMDSAGDNATKKGIELALQEGFEIKVVRIPDGKDPADFAMSHKGELAEKIKEALPIMEYYFSAAIEKNDASSAEGKKKIAEEILPHIKKIKNKVEMYHWLDRLSSIVKVDIKYLEEELKVSGSESGERFKSANAQKKMVNGLNIDNTFLTLMSFIVKSPEKFIQTEVDDFMEFIGKNKDILKDITNEKTLELFDFLAKCVKISSISDILKQASEDEKAVLNRIILQSELIDESAFDVQNEIIFCQDKIKSRVFQFQIDGLHAQIKDAEFKGDMETVGGLLEKLNSLLLTKSSQIYGQNEKIKTV